MWTTPSCARPGSWMGHSPASIVCCPTRYHPARCALIGQTWPTSCCSSLPIRASIARGPTSAKATEVALVSHGFLGRLLALGRAAHDERPGNEQGRNHAKNPKRILIAQHGRLPQQHLVSVTGGCGFGLRG